MSGLKKTTEKNLMVFSGRAHPPELAAEVATILGQQLVPTDAREFANGEIYIRYEESVRGCDASSSRATPLRSTSGSWST